METERELVLLNAFIDVFERLGISVRFESIKIEDTEPHGGLCRFHGNKLMIIEESLRTDEKIGIMTHELGKIPTDHIYLPPNVREALEKNAARRETEK